jgi:hypothetical protein
MNSQELLTHIGRLLETPLETGKTHPLERFLQEELGAEDQTQLFQIIEARSTLSEFADLLEIAGRALNPNQAGWLRLFMHEVANSTHLEKRAVAVYALELWNDPESRAFLRHRSEVEPIGWLADYAKRVSLEASAEHAPKPKF